MTPPTETKMHDQDMEPGEECAGCGVGGRREFLREAAGLLLGALAGLGLSPGDARAFPLELGTAPVPLGAELMLPIPAQDGAVVYKEQSLIVARYAGAVYAFSLACPHQRTALRWLEGDGRFQCPKHKSKYRPDGVFISGRATRGMDRFAVRREGARVAVDLSRLFREDRDRDAWKAAMVPLNEK